LQSISSSIEAACRKTLQVGKLALAAKISCFNRKRISAAPLVVWEIKTILGRFGALRDFPVMDGVSIAPDKSESDE
jgi:hypothetical protein